MTRQLIHKYFTGRCTPEEEVLVKTYLDGDDLTMLHEYLDEMAVSDVPAPLSKEESEELLGRIYHEVQIDELLAGIIHEVPGSNSEAVRELNNESGTGNNKAGEVVPLRRKRFDWRIAASLVFMLVAGSLAYYGWQQKIAISNIAQHNESWSVISNETTGIKKAVLTDGTTVWLNNGSSLAYQPGKFNHSKREVKVSGEAFFDVAHNAHKPFVVRTGKMSTTVLGTAFNVEAYKSEAETKVTLVRGSVRVETGKQQLTLVPGQMLKYLHQTSHAAVTTVDTRQVNAWTTGKISFSDVSLADALKRLSALYSVKITMKNQDLSKNKRITGVFERKSVDKILSNILYVHGLKWEKKGGEIIIQQ